jgi:hypothetical protein
MIQQTDMRPEQENHTRSLGQLFKDLKDEGQHLFRQEIVLAKTEILEKLHELRRDAINLAAGGAIGVVAALTLVAAASIALAALLAQVMPMAVASWLGPLIVGTVLAVVAWVMMRRGRKGLSETDLTPTRTKATLKENKEWIRQRLT